MRRFSTSCHLASLADTSVEMTFEAACDFPSPRVAGGIDGRLLLQKQAHRVEDALKCSTLGYHIVRPPQGSGVELR